MPTRKEVLARYFAYSLGEAARTGRFRRRKTASSARRPSCCRARMTSDAAESAAKNVPATLGPRGYDNYHRIVEFMAARAPAVVPAGAWYLSILGISARRTGARAGCATAGANAGRSRHGRRAVLPKPSRRAAWRSTSGWAAARNTWSRSRTRRTRPRAGPPRTCRNNSTENWRTTTCRATPPKNPPNVPSPDRRRRTLSLSPALIVEDDPAMQARSALRALHARLQREERIAVTDKRRRSAATARRASATAR